MLFGKHIFLRFLAIAHLAGTSITMASSLTDVLFKHLETLVNRFI
jgi:hypothetical protein